MGNLWWTVGLKEISSTDTKEISTDSIENSPKTLDDYKSKIKEFISRNLVLDEDIKKEVEDSKDSLVFEDVKKIYEILLDLDIKQTIALKNKLWEDPSFFIRNEMESARKIYNKHLIEDENEAREIEEWMDEMLELI